MSIIGAGNGGQVIAGYLELTGYETLMVLFRIIMGRQKKYASYSKHILIIDDIR